jgi:hypothetical protein
VRFAIGSSALLLLLNAGRAAASERAYRLTWDAPSECPNGAALERYVDQVVGDAATGPVTVRASGKVTRAADGRYAASVELDLGGTESSTRTLDGRDCEAVSQAAALVIALAIRAHAAPAPPPLPPAPKAPPEPAPVVPPSANRGARPRAFLALGPVADFGSTPAATLGLGLSFGLSAVGLRLEPGLAYFAPRSAEVAARAGVGARFSLATAGARVCIPLSRAVLWVAPCLGAGVDWLRGEGFGARIPKNGSAWSGIARAVALGGWDISSVFTVRLELEGALPLTRPEFQVEVDGASTSSVFRRSPVSARAAFGLDVHF